MTEEKSLEIDSESRERIERMFSGCQEVVGINHVESVLSGSPSHSGDGGLVAYVDVEEILGSIFNDFCIGK